MGFSLVSAAEILYHCLFGLILPLCRSGREPPAKDSLYQDKDVECGGHVAVDGGTAHVVGAVQEPDRPCPCHEVGHLQLVPGHGELCPEVRAVVMARRAAGMSTRELTKYRNIWRRQERIIWRQKLLF